MTASFIPDNDSLRVFFGGPPPGSRIFSHSSRVIRSLLHTEASNKLPGIVWQYVNPKHIFSAPSRPKQWVSSRPADVVSFVYNTHIDGHNHPAVKLPGDWRVDIMPRTTVLPSRPTDSTEPVYRETRFSFYVCSPAFRPTDSQTYTQTHTRSARRVRRVKISAPVESFLAVTTSTIIILSLLLLFDMCRYPSLASCFRGG